MSYESAIKKANDILKVVKFFKENPEYLADENHDHDERLRRKIVALFDTNADNYSLIELAYDYISLNRNGNIVNIERHATEESFNISDILSLSTEEGYFQGSTVYEQGTLDNLCTFSVIYQKSVLDVFYLDTAELDTLTNFVTTEEATFE